MSIDRRYSKRDGVRNVTCCPTIAIAIAGPFIMAMGVVMTDKVIVQRLTDYIYTGREMDFDSHCLRVAKFFHAVGRCIYRLGDYYAGISPSLIHPDSKHPRFFPSITSYRNEKDGVLHSFRYVRYLEKDPSCVTLLAQENDGGRFIVVKFVRQYGIAAHRLLAPRFAPDVLCIGPVGQYEGSPSYGKYQMVVMEWINGESAAVLKKQDKLPPTFIRDVREAVKRLHASNYVFGDLRHQNIMVCQDGKIKLVISTGQAFMVKGNIPCK
jgi:serine/threonine protein kinase